MDRKLDAGGIPTEKAVKGFKKLTKKNINQPVLLFLAEDEIIALNGIPSNFEFSLKVIKSDRESFLIRFPFILILVFSSIKSSSTKDFCNEQLTVKKDSINISFIFTYRFTNFNI